jgi:hypothetical protein
MRHGVEYRRGVSSREIQGATDAALRTLALILVSGVCAWAGYLLSGALFCLAVGAAGLGLLHFLGPFRLQAAWSRPK